MWRRDGFLNYWWNDKIVYVSKHALDELEQYDKTIDFIGIILEDGKYKLVSKKKKKYEARLKVGKIIWNLIYAIHENKVVIIRIGIGERL